MSSVSTKEFKKYINVPYDALVLAFEQAVKNMAAKKRGFGDADRCMEIVVTQMSVGKSTCTDTNLREIIKKHLPEIQLILRLSGKRDTSDDGVFTTNESGWCGLGFHTPRAFETKLDVLEYSMDQNENTSYCMSMTHSLFVHGNSQKVLDFLDRNQQKILIVIEETHEYLACPVEGANEAKKVSGNSGGAPYHAIMPKVILKWLQQAPYVFGLSATPTVAQDGTYGVSQKVDKDGKVVDVLCLKGEGYDLEYPFRVIDASAELKDLLPHQSWVQDVKEYRYEYKNSDSAVNALRGSLRNLLNKQDALGELKKRYDSNITPKCVWMGVFGRGGKCTGWGMPINEGKDQTLKYLKDNNFDEDKFCIITMTQSGVLCENLKGETKKIEDDKTACKMLNDPHNDAQFLFVVNKGTSGLNIYRISNLFIGRVRSLKLCRIERLLQIYGRCVRLNVGTDVVDKSRIKNDLRYYIDIYSEEYGVSADVILKTLLLSNTFSITIPSGYIQRKTKQTLLKHDVEIEAMKQFFKKFCNKVERGRDYLIDFLKNKGVERCPTCGQVLSKEYFGKFEHSWEDFSVLDEFFNS